MRKLLFVIPLAVLLCFTFACQNKAEKAELEKFRAQAKVEEQNKASVKHFFQEMNKGNIEIIREMCAPEYVFYYPSGVNEPISLEEIMDIFKVNFRGFPDLNFEVHEIFAKEDKVVCRYTATGTHSGDWYDLPASGNKIKATVIVIWKMKDGKCIESREESDMLGLMQQLGMELKPKEVKK